MQLKAQVTSLELSRELKELGVKQESAFYWEDSVFTDGWELKSKERATLKGSHEIYSAFTVAELGELLPSSIKHTLKGGKEPKYSHYLQIIPDHWSGGKWTILYSSHHSNRTIDFVDDSEAEARAKMLIYLLENNLMETPKRSPENLAA